MLHTETVEAKTLALIRKFCTDDRLKDFVLAGGTGLALQLGHRKSIDIDLFTANLFDVDKVARYIKSGYSAKDTIEVGIALFSRVNGVKVDMMLHGADWIRPALIVDGIRMASLEDIAAMKLHAIVEAGHRMKDFIDIHYMLERFDLEQLLGFYSKKYPWENPLVAKGALIHFNDIQLHSDLHLLDRKFDWQEVVKRLKQAVKNPKQVFQLSATQSLKRINNESIGQKHIHRRGKKR